MSLTALDAHTDKPFPLWRCNSLGSQALSVAKHAANREDLGAKETGGLYTYPKITNQSAESCCELNAPIKKQKKPN